MRIFIPVSGTVFWAFLALGAVCLVSLGWDKVKQASRTSPDDRRHVPVEPTSPDDGETDSTP